MKNLVDYLRENRVDYREGGTHRHVRTGWVGIDCPRCGPGSGKYHLGIREDLGRAVCWRCGGFRVYDLLGQLGGITWDKARDQVGGVRRRAETQADGVERVLRPPPTQPIFGHFVDYLRQRGFSPQTVADLWGVRATTAIAGRWAWRLWIPIYLGGRVVSWTTRKIGTGGVRYISAAPNEELVDHRTLLYGEDQAGHAVVVVEGPTDVWAIGPGAVATMGLVVTEEQVKRIGDHPVRTICFDAELAAQRRARRLCRMLKRYPGETNSVCLPSGKDPATADQNDLVELRTIFLDQCL